MRCALENVFSSTAIRRNIKVPYYPQTTDFTCARPACYAMGACRRGRLLERREELQLWREAPPCS